MARFELPTSISLKWLIISRLFVDPQQQKNQTEVPQLVGAEKSSAASRGFYI